MMSYGPAGPVPAPAALSGRQKAANFAVWVLCRTCAWSGGTILLAIAAGWITP